MVDDYPCVTTAEAAARIGISTVRMTQLCRRGQVSGALRFGHAWMSSSSDSGRSRAGSATGAWVCSGNHNYDGVVRSQSPGARLPRRTKRPQPPSGWLDGVPKPSCILRLGSPIILSTA